MASLDEPDDCGTEGDERETANAGEEFISRMIKVIEPDNYALYENYKERLLHLTSVDH